MSGSIQFVLKHIAGWDKASNFTHFTYSDSRKSLGCKRSWKKDAFFNI